MIDLLKHPLWIFCSLAFWTNQYLEKSLGVFLPVYHSYGDDLLAMPVVFGLCLQVMRWIHPMKTALIFTKTHLLVGLLYFSIIFEVVLPSMSNLYIADPLDVLCYFVGAFIFEKFMNKPALQSKKYPAP